MNMSEFTKLCNAQQDIYNATEAFANLDGRVCNGDHHSFQKGLGSPYMWELFPARDPAVMHCGTASRMCSVRSSFQSFLYKIDFI
ncbi:hypothetical protein M5D96_012052, partial [Drosophila gunungcola]